MIKQKLHAYINSLWERSKNLSHLSFGEKIIFSNLCFCEFFYKLGFAVVIFFKQKRTKNLFSPGKVVSVGNLSVGGTGKSVFVSYVVNQLKNKSAAIMLRGYKRKRTDSDSLVLTRENLAQYEDCVAGDEALQYLGKHSSPVVVGGDRKRSLQKLLQFFSEKNMQLDFVVMDDAYQNFAIQKDVEILLFDARRPFENNHCLPAGRLREKDYTRADVIVLTHSDEVAEDELEKIKKETLQKFNKSLIFVGRHAIVGLWNCATKLYEEDSKNGVIAVSGIGSPNGFESSLKKIQATVLQHEVFPDHHDYTKQDVLRIVEVCEEKNCSSVVMTRKDWQKIRLFANVFFERKIQLFVLDVTFEFLNDDEKRFWGIINLSLH